MIARRFSRPVGVATLLLAISCNRVPLLAPTGSSITITALAAALPNNSSTTLIANVVEQAGTPPQDGTLVVFTTTLGILQPPQAETNGGRAVVTFLSGTQSGTATITASSGGATVAADKVVKIAIGAAAVATIGVTANPTTLGSNGGTTTIAAIARDSGGNPLPNVAFSFTTDAGTLSNSVAVTDQAGTAQVQLTTFTTATVTASAGSSNGTTAITGTVKVTVSQGPTIKLTPPSAAQTVGVPVSLPIDVTKGDSPVKSVVVDWGDGSTTSAGTGGSTAIHTYGHTGIFSVTVTATDVSGNVSSAQTAIQVNDAPVPSVGISVTGGSDTPKVNTAVSFTVNASVPGAGTGSTATTTIRSVHLDFGDGRSADLGAPTSGSLTVSHTYTATGNYTAVATATDTNGRTASASVSITVVP